MPGMLLVPIVSTLAVLAVAIYWLFITAYIKVRARPFVVMCWIEFSYGAHVLSCVRACLRMSVYVCVCVCMCVFGGGGGATGARERVIA